MGIPALFFFMKLETDMIPAPENLHFACQTGPLFIEKRLSQWYERYRDSHYESETVVRQYVYDRDSYTPKQHPCSEQRPGVQHIKCCQMNTR